MMGDNKSVQGYQAQSVAFQRANGVARACRYAQRMCLRGEKEKMQRGFEIMRALERRRLVKER